MRRQAPPEDAAAARARALRLLSRREHGAKELERKLAHRGLDREQAASVVGELAESGWQSDKRYVESLIRSRVHQGWGKRRIEDELEAAGVARQLIRDAFEAASLDWTELVVALHRRRFGDTLPDGAAEWQKRYRFLASRGFQSGEIRAALKREPDLDQG